MSFIADFHIHSHYSRATSPQLTAPGLHKWGQIKGIKVMGTGDFTHPSWFTELQDNLESAEPGLFKLNNKIVQEVQPEVPQSCHGEMRYLLSVEISSIYSKNGRVRKIHSIICSPTFQAAAKINHALDKIGNIKHDGRPILGIDAKELLKIVMDASPDCMFIPAHVWTPHFALFGSNSGFDSIEECFEEMTEHITALETGLSSDPAMNYLWSDIDRFTLVSNSDAHSPMKLGREANRLNCELNYFDIKETIKSGNPDKFLETIEFYPEEGKYHCDGHRNCKVSMTPEETKEANGICPKCERKVTVGVLNRVMSLADRKDPEARPNRIPYRYLVPLNEILSNIHQVGPNSKTVMTQYWKIIAALGNEFHILLDAPLSEIEKIGGPQIALAIDKVRRGDIYIKPGYDGEYGIVQVFSPEELEIDDKQTALF
ncbi:MAG: endonuclease Q family protein [Candidatus Gracilibacteria bacterium]